MPMFEVVALMAMQLQFGDGAKGSSLLGALRHPLALAAEHVASWRVIPPPSRSSMLPRWVEGQSPSTLVGSPHPLAELAAAGRSTQRRAVAGHVVDCPLHWRDERIQHDRLRPKPSPRAIASTPDDRPVQVASGGCWSKDGQLGRRSRIGRGERSVSGTHVSPHGCWACA